MNATTGADFTINVMAEEKEEEQTINEQLIMAIHDLQSSNNNEKLLEFVRSYYSINSLNEADISAALSQPLHPINIQSFFDNLSRLYRQQLLMRDTLQFFHNTFKANLHCIGSVKKVSAFFFPAAAAISAALAATNSNPQKPAAIAATAAAAAAAVLFVALGNRIHSVLNKRESGVERQNEIIRLMIMGAIITAKDLRDIHVLGRRLQLEAVDDDEVGEKRRFENLIGKAGEYNRDLKSWATQVVLPNVITLH